MTGGGGSTRPAGCAAGPDTISDFEEGTTGITIPQAGRQGWWYTFSDPNAGAQTPAKNATGPVMTAMDSTDPNAGTCGMNKWAMHSTSSGHINYVGFGTSIAQVLPAPPATATTTKTKNPYDTTTSMYDGVVFDIKSGSGTAPNVWFELANSENQPQPDGTIKTADGTAERRRVASPSSNATDEYNTRGKLLTNVTTTWQTVYVPFGLLAPRYLPAQATTGPCANGAIFCEAPAFNPKSLLGLQFSVYDQFPKAGTTAGTYDLWVDNVAFYKGANGLATFTPSPNTAKPFPQDRPGRGLRQADRRQRQVPGRHVPALEEPLRRDRGNPTRVVRPENQNDTVSEGIGYGMLIAVYMGDRTLFDGLYAYWVAHPAERQRQHVDGLGVSTAAAATDRRVPAATATVPRPTRTRTSPGP